MKELFGQSLVNTVAESDRVAVAVPGQVAAKNILFSKFWAQLKAKFATNNWSARTYESSPSIVVVDKKQYILDESIAPLPFNSTDFTTELAANIWVALGGGGSGASTAANVLVDATGFNGNLATTDNNQQLVNQKIDDLPIWINDSTAWVGNETTLTLTSQKRRLFGSVAVTTAVTVTLVPPPSPYLEHYAFKFKYGVGGSFAFTGVHSSTGNPTLTAGKIYEASITDGELIYKEVA